MPNTSIPKNERVSLGTKIFWGFGGLADNFMFNTLNALGLLIYVKFFEMPNLLAGVALAVPRFMDAITDPLIGNWSDNCRSPKGRRIPFMLWGVISCALILPFLWTPPYLETIDNPWYSNAPFWYLTLVGSALAFFYTLFVVPYTALGFELTPNYDERTRVVAWRMYIGLAGSLGSFSLYKLINLDVFNNQGQGAFWVSIGISVIVLASGMIPVAFVKENQKVRIPDPIKIGPAFATALKNKNFLILFFAYVIIVVATISGGSVLPFLMIPYVLDGSDKAWGDLSLVLGFLSVGMSYVSLFLIGWISRKWSKSIAMSVGIAFALVGTALLWPAIDPRWPWALYITSIIAFLGFQGCWLMVDTITADICDEDELITGRRREGMFSAVKGFTLKLAITITSLVGGGILQISGYDAKDIKENGITPDVVFDMKLLIVGTQCAGLLAALIIMIYYPLTRKQAERNRELLKIRHTNKQLAHTQ
ncbi:MFS transporter [Pelagicoccus sp. NFK12]|uniref:MFS transporter n=1 Tax=Pelagicoccus enzymogenes TaxID=2773457 RepID=A0A927IGX0_9BACT|nr:MFS transporter [Pelagicoccus enzymogenes]MBD5781632.1 MFS transporter [Pelagicoccus enzymogenes]